MITESDFDDIRPYNDSEVVEVINRLLQEEAFIKFAQQLFPGFTKEMIEKALSEVKSIKEFQGNFIIRLAQHIIDNTTKGITIDGLENLDPNESYLFISDHRDIILDSALLNVMLHHHGFETTEIAIGSNLLIQPWIADLVKLNKSFVVNRNVTVRQMLESSKQLSNYINFALNTKKSSIWIAQREGRTKDGDDRTQQSLLKMLQMSGGKEFCSHFKNLRIVPVAISYEYEPCDAMKTLEVHLKETESGYQKTAKDDLRSMIRGMINEKGRVHFHIGKPISQMLDTIEDMDESKDKFKALADLIDYRIHKNYKLWPDNYIAYDIVNNSKEFLDKYTIEEKELFLKHMEKKIATIEDRAENMERLHQIFFEIYANPVKNRLELTKPEFVED
ncbi:1-acyl-sn-glycerol-3-phosphate acyltransferase [Marinifilum sp. D737]|uniref:1-acyl-sn-glycerol-3-phosphate acyltransferase n=1 Tax=Marinifilum sp. D737 TaxID=2969628 RepID=UPI00227515D9|nr:1-acyl-sn-glycerol-3-phosphate acyltransferase [Marinifilum sp. D737]MCY1636018.1 1-acyl-sn-glycerol-3-phosphate acyltransferase [Marinifilum sp. D737]